MADELKTQTPVTRRGVQRLRAVAVVAVDSAGDTRFAGTPSEIELAIQRWSPRGPSVAWFYETRRGERLPWPSMVQGSGRSDTGAFEAPLLFAERLAELNRNVYRDAYTNVRELMGAALDSMAQVNVALSNRLISVEERLEELQNRPGPAPAQGDSNDELVRMVLDRLTEGRK